MASPTLVLFQRDLRIGDNPALSAAMRAGPAIALYVLDDSADERPLGGAARWWLHFALQRLAADLSHLGVPLILRRGTQNTVIASIAQGLRASGIYWSRRYTPWGTALDTSLKAWAKDTGIAAQSFAGSYLVEPWAVQTKQGQPFKVFTPFYKSVLAVGEPTAPLAPPSPQTPPHVPIGSDKLTDWNLLPRTPDWAAGLRETWQGNGTERLARFLDEIVGKYPQTRDRPDLDGTSALSPYLAFGELSPRQIWHSARRRAGSNSGIATGVEAYLRQLVWRDFCSSLLYHFPHMAKQPFQEKFAAFPWADDPEALNAWRRGRTGYPWIDAGMRQLWETGWMHNRVRMGVASFLTKHLLLPWQAGEAWFWDTLVDADPAQNIANWQWVAGCGADAAPYFRIFNPITQGDKFDPEGAYLHRWQPEALSYDAGAAGIPPLVDHRAARERALAAYEAVKGA
jgi:deoxyribodipyrimidine photo-lyase